MYQDFFQERRELEQIGDSIMDTMRASIFMSLNRNSAERMVELNYRLYPEIRVAMSVLPCSSYKPWYEVTDKMLDDTLMMQCIMLIGKLYCLASWNSHLLDYRYWGRMTLREILNYAKEYICQKGYFSGTNTMGQYSSYYPIY